MDQLRQLGLPERMIEGERDAWILVAAHSPERMAGWIALKREQIEERGWSGWTQLEPATVEVRG